MPLNVSTATKHETTVDSYRPATEIVRALFCATSIHFFGLYFIYAITNTQPSKNHAA